MPASRSQLRTGDRPKDTTTRISSARWPPTSRGAGTSPISSNEAPDRALRDAGAAAALEEVEAFDFEPIRLLLGRRLIDRRETWKPAVTAMGDDVYPMSEALMRRMRIALDVPEPRVPTGLTPTRDHRRHTLRGFPHANPHGSLASPHRPKADRPPRLSAPPKIAWSPRGLGTDSSSTVAGRPNGRMANGAACGANPQLLQETDVENSELGSSRPIRKRSSARAVTIALVAAAVIAASACSSSSKPSTGTTPPTTTSGSSPAATLTPASFTSDFSAMAQLKSLAAKGKGLIGVLLPDTTTSARYETFDRPYLTKAFKAAGLSGPSSRSTTPRAARRRCRRRPTPTSRTARACCSSTRSTPGAARPSRHRPRPRALR